MIRVLFVCHGNICRSPMAEVVFREMVRGTGLEGAFEIASAATSMEELGRGIYPQAQRMLRMHKLPCPNHCARQMKRADYEKWDYLIGMERLNIRNMQRITGGDPKGKMHLLLSFAGSDGEIDDPWYMGNYERVFEQIQRGCAGLLEALVKEMK